MPEFPRFASPQQIHETYKQGFKGWIWNKTEQDLYEKLWSGRPDIYGACLEPDKLKDLHKKYKRVLLWRYRLRYDPRAWHEERQTTGDCTSHGSRNARDTTRCVEIARGDAEIFYRRTATEPTYGARGHAGQGMAPSVATKFEMEFGFLFRDIYRDANLGVSLDLSKYNSNIGTNWGRSGVPKAVKELCKKYNVGDRVRPRNAEEALDCFAAGFGCHSGQEWGTSSRQPKDGINRGPGELWSHDMASLGYDFSCEFFKVPVVFVFNSWEDWNDPNPVWMANQDVYGPWVPGAIVVALDEWEEYFVKSGSIDFYVSIKGMPIKELPWITNTMVT